MGWAVGYDTTWRRFIGYGVPAVCDHPGCSEAIDRGLSYVCGGEPYGGEHGCGLYFCSKQLADDSWQEWREQHPELASEIAQALAAKEPPGP